MKWTKENILAEAFKYQYKADWIQCSMGSYLAASRSGILPLAASHMLNGYKKPKKWTKDLIIAEAQQYTSKTEWRRLSRGSYRAALGLGIYEEISKHLHGRHAKWTEATILQEALKYSTKVEWVCRSHSSYNAARRLGIADRVTLHMKILRQDNWTEEMIVTEAKKYNTRAEWERNSQGSYIWAHRRGIADIACRHMAISCGTSRDEINLLKSIQKYYSEAVKARFGHAIKGQCGQYFELDIYIPTLRKGIEFNGDYWHSPAGLKRGRPNWSTEAIQNYPQIKRAFFTKQGIDYIDIAEHDWNANPQECLDRIYQFLDAK